MAADIHDFPGAAEPVKNIPFHGSLPRDVLRLSVFRRKRAAEERRHAHALQAAQSLREKEQKKKSTRDTVSVLRVLLAMALRGTLGNVAVIYEKDGEDEEVVTTGAYRDPQRLTKAALRASWAATESSQEE